MDDTEPSHDGQVSLSNPDYLFNDCWMIPHAAERELGPAAQTLGAFERLCVKNGTTFASVARIAQEACLPPRTCQVHIAKLLSKGWIERVGRQKRRTITYKITKKCRDELNGSQRRLYPRFSGPEWTWSMRAVFALVANAQLAAAIGSRETTGDMPEDLGEDFVLRSVSAIARQLGLTRPSVMQAITRLTELGYLYSERFEHSQSSLMLYVDNAPMPLRGCKNPAQLDCKKPAQQKPVDWKNPAHVPVKNLRTGCKKPARAVNTTLKTTSKNHHQAPANAPPDGSSFLCVGGEGRSRYKQGMGLLGDLMTLDYLRNQSILDGALTDSERDDRLFCVVIARAWNKSIKAAQVRDTVKAMGKLSRIEQEAWLAQMENEATEVYEFFKGTKQ